MQEKPVEPIKSEISLFYRLGEIIGASLEFERVCSAILEEGRRRIGADCGLLFTKQKNKVELLASVGISEDRVLLYKENLEYGQITKLSQEGEDKIFCFEKNSPEQEILNLGKKGLFTKHKNVMILYSGKDFTQDDLNLAKALVSYTTGIITSAGVYMRMQDLFFDTIIALSSAIDAKDPYTAGHSRKVKDIALVLADELNLDENQKRILKLCALLHDIGKIFISEKILTKPGKLTKEEYEIVKKHPEMGAKIISQVSMMEEVLRGVAEHQERYDGLGYPKGLKGKKISLYARILAVADAYDAMTSPRAYRPPKSRQEAYREIIENSNKQFDPEIVEAFKKAFLKNEL